jgi:predicted phage-related endonuclease
VVEREYVSVTVSAIRQVRIGGSTIAAAAGIDPHLSRAGLFLRLAGVLPEPDENEAMTVGKAIEPAVVTLVAERGFEVLAYPASEYRDESRPYLVGHPDVLLAQGSPLVGEVKVTGGWARRNWQDGNPPVAWQAQAQTYLHLTGLDRALVAALIDGTHLETVEIYRDQRAVDLLLDRADEF